MPSIARGQTSDCANPVLDLYTRLGGVLTNVAQASFQIFDKTAQPAVQVYPVSGRQAVDVATSCPTGDTIGAGHYVARWTVPLAEAVGTHEVRWFIKLALLSEEQTFEEEFVVIGALEVTGGGTPRQYATVEQLRDEGVTTSQASDPQLLAKIIRSSALIDHWTGRWFYPKASVLTLDGRGRDILQIGPPIISISEVRLLGQGSMNLSSPSEVVELTNLRVYNRHLTQGLTDPDDRNNPKIQWLSFDQEGQRLPGIMPYGSFPHGVQNIQLTGVFGYTDPDGTPTGKTPDLINYACMQMVVRDLPKLGDAEARDEAQMRGRVTSLRTRDQSISWSQSAKAAGLWTGDSSIDGIIASFRRPPTLGAV